MSCRLAVAFVIAALLSPKVALAAASIELYGTFNAMGVTVTMGAGDDPDQDATASLSYRLHGAGAYRTGLPLARVAATRFVGSMFWLTAGTSYDVRVTITDPDHGSIDGATVEATGSTRAEVTLPAPQRTYFVSPSGSGTSCTQAAPCSLSDAMAQAEAGSEIQLRGGVYYFGAPEEGVHLAHSGSAGAPIVIRSAAGESAILDGSDPGAFTWTAQGGGVYSTTTRTPSPHVVMANGQRLFPYQSLADLGSLRYGVPGFFASGTSLSARLAGDADPAGASMVVSRYLGAFHVEAQSFIYLIGLTFRYYGQGDWAKAVYLLDASDNLIRGCTFASCDVGVGLKYDSHRNVIEDSTFYDTITNFPWQAVKDVGSLEDGGVAVFTPFSGRGTVIRRNELHHDFDGLHVCNDDPMAATLETDFYQNVVHDTTDNSIETDGECSNVRIWSNTLYNSLMSVSLAPVRVGPVYAIRNVIYGVGTLAEGGGSGFKLNSDEGLSGPIYLFHNTVDAVVPSNSALLLYEPGEWKSLVARNNVWSGTSYAIENYNVSQPADLDYDDLFTTRANELTWWYRPDDSHQRTLSAFQAATGQELHGLSVAPGFASPAAGDYNLTASSPLRDQGVVIPGVNDDYEGAAPDLGAIEYRDSTGCSVACSATVPTAAQATLPIAFAATASTSGCSGTLTWDWDFGDGSSHAVSQSTTHIYPTSTTYTWKLTVTADGKTCVRSGAITVGSPPPPVTYLIPAVAHNPGAAGTQWRTDLAAVNRSGIPVSLSLTLHTDTASVSRSASLADAAATEWRDVLVSLFALPASTSSSGVVEVSASMPIGLASRTYNQTSSGTYGQSYPALRSSDALASGRVGLLPQLRKSSAFRTNIGVLNLGSASATVSIALWSSTGSQLGTTKVMTVAGGRWTQQYDIFAAVGAGSQEVAYATVSLETQGAAVWAYASLIDAATGDPTTIPVLAP
jgi:PKD repeat protein